MFDTRWRKVRGDLWLHRGRSLLVLLAVSIALIGAGSVLNAWALVQRATDQGYAASLPVSATLTVAGLRPEWLAQLRAVPQIDALRLRRTMQTKVRAEGSWRNATLFAIDDFERPAEPASIGRLIADGGAWPPPAGALLIERSSLEFSGAMVGQVIAVQSATGESVALPLAGIVRDVSQAPGWMEHQVYLYANIATLEKLGAPPGYDQLQLRVSSAADRAAVRRVAAAVQALIEDLGGELLAVDVPPPGEHIHAAQMGALIFTQGVFGLLSLLVCAFLVVNLIGAILAGQSREIAVIKTLGGSVRQIAGMYLFLAGLLGLLASFIALPIALLIGRAYAGFKVELLNFPLDGYRVPAWAIALQLLVGCALPVLAAAIPVHRATRISVAAALRDVGIVVDGALRPPRWLSDSALPRIWVLATANALRQRGRVALTLLGLAVGGAVFLGAANLRQAVIGSVDLLFASQRFDLSVRLADPQPADQLQALATSVAGVQRAEVWRRARASLPSREGLQAEPFTLLGLPVPSTDSPAMLQPHLDAGRWLAPADQRVLVVSRRLMQGEPELQAGASMKLSIDGRSQSWRVIGVIDAGPQSLAYVPRAALDQLFADDRAGIVTVALAVSGQAAQLEAIAQLREAFGAAGIAVAGTQLLSENRRVVEDHLLMVVDFLAVMGWLMLLVGGMGLASTMSLAVLERTREIGVLRALGAGHRSIMTIIQVEGLLIATLAWALAIPLSVPMSIGLGATFGRMMFSVPTLYLPATATLFSWLCLMWLIALIACAWPARNACRVPAKLALSYEG